MSSQRYISDTLKRKKKKVQTLKAYVVIFSVLMILGGLVYASRMPQMHIVNVEIWGNGFVTTEEIQTKADEVLDSEYLFLIPKRNIFIFPKSELISKIKKNPAVIDVRISKKYFDSMRIEITEQEKEALYCNSFDRVECFYLNAQGYIYSRVTSFIVPESEVIIYLEGEQKQLRENIDDEELYENIITFIKSSTRLGIPLASAYIKTDGVIEFNTRDGARILTSRYDDFEKGFSNFMVLFDQGVMTKEDLRNVDYIDVRFGNKVFYKNRTN